MEIITNQKQLAIIIYMRLLKFTYVVELIVNHLLVISAIYVCVQQQHNLFGVS